MAKPADNLRINGERLWESIHEMAKIGPGVRGGNNRQTLTDADAEGRRLFQRWCEDAGMTVEVDQMGTMFARREGADPSLPPVVIGSHLDTQPTGGRYDGVLGVLGGAGGGALAQRPRPQDEVPDRSGQLDQRGGNALRPGDARLRRLRRRARARLGLRPQGRRGPPLRRRAGADRLQGQASRSAAGPFHALFELHIEQGPILEAEGKDIGVVTHGQGLWWLQVTLTGKDAHTGSTPMPMRRNAGLGMARITELVHQIAMENQPRAVGAIGHVEVYPNSRNVIPGKVVFTIDFRSPDKATLDGMKAKLEAEAPKIAEELGLGIAIEVAGHFDPVTFDETCVAAVRDAAERLGYSHRDIISGAGHDACWINRVAPTAMVMCPCVDGLSHNEDETITKEWATAGAEVLFHAAIDTAEIVE